jgi:peptide deformylase
MINQKIFTTTNELEKKFLNQKSFTVDMPIKPYVLKIIKSMKDTLIQLGGGAGIAAPQIGINLRIMICSYNRDINSLEIVINPSYYAIGNHKEYYWEGCFSIPNTIAKVARWTTIHVAYFNTKGEEIKKILTAKAAEIFQHEYDHLEGKLIIDNAQEIRTFQTKESSRKFLTIHS